MNQVFHHTVLRNSPECYLLHHLHRFSLVRHLVTREIRKTLLMHAVSQVVAYSTVSTGNNPRNGGTRVIAVVSYLELLTTRCHRCFWNSDCLGLQPKVVSIGNNRYRYKVEVAQFCTPDFMSFKHSSK